MHEPSTQIQDRFIPSNRTALIKPRPSSPWLISSLRILTTPTATLPLCLLFALWSALLSSVHSLPLPILEQQCPHYAEWSKKPDGKELSGGRYQLPFQRPSDECRTFYSQEVEDAIERLRPKIADPDLFRLFENAYPNTLDTAVKWKGFAWKDEQEGTSTDEDLAFVITGDMYAGPSLFRIQADFLLEMQCGYAIRQIKSSPTCQSSKRLRTPTPWPPYFAA